MTGEGGPLLDEAHLARQTFGDAALRREVLALFAAQVERLLPRLDDARERNDALHTLKGAARAVGAVALGIQAEACERAWGQDTHAALARTARATLAHPALRSADVSQL